MKQGAQIAMGILVVAALAAGGGYWIGQRGMSGGLGAAPAGIQPGELMQARKLLYYRNPMGLADTSPVPKKDSMGMDYIPVYAEGDEDRASPANQIRISTDKIQKLGVRTEAATIKTIDKIVRAAGRIEPDEGRLYTIAPKFEGYVERLHVNATGQAITKGQALFEAYSPELVSAQREYMIAAQGVTQLTAAGGDAQAGMRQLAQASLLRLKNWDISEEQLKALAKSGEVRRTMSFRATVSGIVTEKKAVQGMRFMPGDVLYQITDLSTVWVLADVFEQDIGQVKPGAKASVRIDAYPDKVFEATIAYVYPTLRTETRTVQVRLALANPGLLLKPGMFAQVELAAGPKNKVVTVPLSAVIDSGTRRIVLIQGSAGRFEPREVKLGARSDDAVEVLGGVREGELVVVTANFLIDAESNLKAALGSFGQVAPATSAAKTAGHQALGTVESVDAKTGTVSLNHGPVASLKWPAMTMEFKLANKALLRDLQPGASVAVEFVERQPGEWVITSVKPGAALNLHGGH